MGWVCSALADAQDTATYDVELIIFANAPNSAPQAIEELPSVPDLSQTGLLFDNGRQPTEQSRLKDSWQRLVTSPQHRPLLYLSWRQPLPDPSQSERIRVRYPEHSSSDAETTLRGWIGLGRQRHALLEVDLLLLERGKSYRMRERSRMNRNEVHYLDHPMLGVFATLTRVH